MGQTEYGTIQYVYSRNHEGPKSHGMSFHESLHIPIQAFSSKQVKAACGGRPRESCMTRTWIQVRAQCCAYGCALLIFNGIEWISKFKFFKPPNKWITEPGGPPAAWESLYNTVCTDLATWIHSSFIHCGWRSTRYAGMSSTVNIQLNYGLYSCTPL